MSVVGDVLGLERVRDESAAWSLLRADNAPVAVAVLARHLGGEQQRRPTADIIELVDADLDALRGHGYVLPRTGQAYCAEWRAINLLVRRPAEDTRSETFELSPDALAAIRFLTDLASPRQSVTESRLATIADRLSRLAQDTDTDKGRRLAALHAERDRIEREIERIDSGDSVAVLDDARARERAAEIVQLAEALPVDFARVREKLERINRDLRERIIDSDDVQRHVLDEIFRGVDVLNDSPEGRSFTGFYSLILDPELGSRFETNIQQILERDFAKQLPKAQRQYLRRLLRLLQERGGEVHQVMTTFARGLRRFVQSQEYQRDRIIKRELKRALSEAVPVAAETRPWKPVGFSLDLTSVALDSVSRLQLHNPADSETVAVIEIRDEAPVDLEMLRLLARESEIDYVELTGNVNEVIGVRGPSTIAEVLGSRPATQGVASVVGLLALAERYGARLPGVERVYWQPQDTDENESRAATIEKRVFERNLP